ncbi:hypothetical protein PV326_013620, partial [Microctonus aethiopoides]
VTSLLLEGERRKLAVLQRELQVALAEGGSVKVKEKARQELLHAISARKHQPKHYTRIASGWWNQRDRKRAKRNYTQLQGLKKWVENNGVGKIQGQHEQLDKEYRIHAAGVILCNTRGSGK